MSKKPVHVEVVLYDGETVERLIKRFLKKCKKEEIIELYKEHQTYKKPSDIRREKKKKRDRVFYKMKMDEEKRNKKSNY